jgi:DNA polymerase-3 subunit epsilon
MNQTVETGCDIPPSGRTPVRPSHCSATVDLMSDSMLVQQRTLDDLGSPLHDVTFVVFDVETTGGKASEGAITEIGAVKLRAGECIGTYQTLVNPGQAIPPEITVLTGITDAMVVRAPAINEVLGSFLDFVGPNSVLVGHNVRYDLSFMGAALARAGYPKLTNRSVDTLPLARRLVGNEVPNCKLGTLASRLRLDHLPAHRALDDALATGDLLHFLLERAGALGVTGLDDLLALPTMAGNAQAAKLRLTEQLPRQPGVYLFRGRQGEVLYVGKATNLRARVRSYFSTDERRKIGQLLRETHQIDHRVCRNGLEAAVVELRLIHEHLPRFNRQGTRSARYPYVKLTLNERFPRLSVVRTVQDDGALYLGPLSSSARARRLIEAIETTSPIRRCNVRATVTAEHPVCTPAQIGVACCPCSGQTPDAEYQQVVDDLIDGLTQNPHRLLDPLEAKISALAGEERYEEAADVRDQADALSSALRRQRRFDLLRRAETVRFQIDGVRIELRHGQLDTCTGASDPPTLWACEPTATTDAAAPSLASDLWLTPPLRHEADELLCVARWIETNADRIILEHVSGALAEPLPRLPDFSPRSRTATAS